MQPLSDTDPAEPLPRSSSAVGPPQQHTAPERSSAARKLQFEGEQRSLPRNPASEDVLGLDIADWKAIVVQRLNGRTYLVEKEALTELLLRESDNPGVARLKGGQAISFMDCNGAPLATVDGFHMHSLRV